MDGHRWRWGKRIIIIIKVIHPTCYYITGIDISRRSEEEENERSEDLT